MEDLSVDAVLLDSGGVLIGPVGGRWNPRFDFEEIVARHAPNVKPDQLSIAIAAGDEFLTEAAVTPSRDDYHRVVLGALGVNPTPDLLAELDGWVDPAKVVEPFPDVIAVLDQLRARGLRLAVVSDAWPTLPGLHAGVGLGGYFEAYAISAVLGCTKPDPRMFRHASDALGLSPERCLFVDDWPPNVQAALGLGYQGCVLLRDGSTHADVRSIGSLFGLLDLVR